jgi:hypothetical protein
MVRLKIIDRKTGLTEDYKMFKDFGPAADWYNNHKLKNNTDYQMTIDKVPGNLFKYKSDIVWSYRYHALPIIIGIGLLIYILKVRH